MRPDDNETRLDLQNKFAVRTSGDSLKSLPGDSLGERTGSNTEKQSRLNQKDATKAISTPHQLSNQQLLDQLADQFAAELRSGRSPSIADYQKSNPKLANEIADVLSSVAMIEDLKRQSDSLGSPQDRFGELNIERLGDYRIVREVGRGGMGVVFEAVHESLGRKVAIKVLPSRIFGDQAALVRFHKEAHAAANLHHSNIVNVFGVGEADGLHYYVMEFVDGITLADVVRTLVEEKQQQEVIFSARRDGTESIHPPDRIPDFKSDLERFRWSADLLAQIADGIHYSHQQNILHRDIKPQNLLLDEKNKPWITDFGLVKDITSQTMTKTGDLFGTPQYMAPESLEGQYDARSEVYCMGLTLYELLVAQPAFANTSPTQVFRTITSQSPTPLRQIDPTIPLDLETIVQKSIEKSPSQRYRTAGEFRDDLYRFLEDRPIMARPISKTEKAVRWCRRNPLVAALSSLSAALLIVVAIVSTSAYLSTNRAYLKLDEKHSALVEQQKETQSAKDLADQNAKQARQNAAQMRAESKRAEANVDLAMLAFDDLFRKIMSKGAGRDLKSNMELEGFAELSSIGTLVTKGDAKILESVIRFYKEFTEKNEENEELKIEIAKAFRRIANIYHLTGELNLAEDGYRKACDTFSEIVENAPDDIESVLDLAECHNELAGAYRKNNKTLASLNEHRSAMRLLQNEDYKKLESCRYVLAGTLIYVGTFGEGKSEDLDDFLAHKQNWRIPRESMRANSFRVPNGKRTEANRNARSTFFRNQNSNRDSMPRIRDWERIRLFRQGCLRRAEEIAESLYESDKGNGSYRLLRAQVYRSKASMVGVDGERRWQTAQLRRAVAELEKLNKDFPDKPLYRYVLAQTLAIEVQNSDDQYLLQMKESGAAICRSLIKDFPLVIEYIELAANLNEQLATVYLKSDSVKAKSSLQEAQRLLLKLISEVPRLSNYSYRYANTSLRLSDLMIEEKAFGAAERELKGLIDFLQSKTFQRGAKKLELLEASRKRLKQIRRN